MNATYIHIYYISIYIRSLFSRLAFSFSFFYTLSPFVSLRPDDKTKIVYINLEQACTTQTLLRGK